MNELTEIKTLDDWMSLSREQKLEKLFVCPDLWRCHQAQDLWGEGAYGFGDMVNIPYGVSWEEVVKVVFATKHYCKITLKVKPEYISDIDLDEFMHLVKRINKPGKICQIDPRYVQKEFFAFSKWRRKYSGKSKCLFYAERFNDNSLILFVCTEEGDRGDEDGFGVEPDMWTSAIFDLHENPIIPFRPGIIQREEKD